MKPPTPRRTPQLRALATVAGWIVICMPCAATVFFWQQSYSNSATVTRETWHHLPVPQRVESTIVSADGNARFMWITQCYPKSDSYYSTSDDAGAMNLNVLIWRDDDRLVVGEWITISMQEVSGPGGASSFHRQISADGGIRLPYLHSLRAAGRTPEELEKAIVETYRVENIIQRVQLSVGNDWHYPITGLESEEVEYLAVPGSIAYVNNLSGGSPPTVHWWEPDFLYASTAAISHWNRLGVEWRSVRLPNTKADCVSVSYRNLFALAAVLPTVRLLRKVRRLWRSLRHKPGTCSRCGYNLQGNVSGVCPECGTPTSASCRSGRSFGQRTGWRA